MKILVAGDYYPASKLKQQIDLRDYSFLEEINSYTKRVDYSIVNFESPVVLGKYEPIKKCGPNLQSSKYAIEAISYAGFNLLTLATKDYLVPKKKLLGIRKAYLILNEAILNYTYGLIKLEELNDAVKKEKTLLLHIFMKTDEIITI